MTPKEIWESVNGKYDHGNVVDRAGVFMLAGTLSGARDETAANGLDISSDEAAEFTRNARASGIWGDECAYVDWDDEENGGVSLMMDAMCVAGLLTRS